MKSSSLDLSEILKRIAPSLIETRSGFWSATEIDNVSYPEEARLKLADIEETSFWFRHRNKILVDAVKRYSNGSTLFDIGGGNGYVSLGLKREGISSVVVEPGSDGANIAFQRGLPVINASFSELLFEKNSLPAVGLFDVIEHIADDRAFLSQIIDLMVPGGYLFITVPTYQLLWSVDDEYAGHFRRYNRRGLSRVLKLAGFDIVQLSDFFSLLVAPLFLFRSVPSKLGLRKIDTADKAFTHHSQSTLSLLFEKMTGFERSLISREKTIPIGTSALAIARKPLI